MKNFKVRNGPDGIHFFNRNNGINILLDDTVPLKLNWTTCPRQVSIALTNLCNFKCSHCYAPKKQAMLDKNKVKAWMSELDKSGCFGVGFGGGEPTLHPNLVEICQYGQLNTQLAISLTTHGHQLDKQLINELEGNVNFIRVSMDGINSTYEMIRGRSFEKLKYNLALLSGRILFGINYVVNAKTINDLNAAADIIESFGASELLLLPEEAVGLGQKIDDNSLSVLKQWVAKYKGGLRLAVSSHYQHELNAVKILPQEHDSLAFAHIDAEGVIKKTSFDAKGCVIDEKGVITAFSKLKGDK